MSKTKAIFNKLLLDIHMMDDVELHRELQRCKNHPIPQLSFVPGISYQEYAELLDLELEYRIMVGVHECQVYLFKSTLMLNHPLTPEEEP